ncbi:hypothetical protein EV426DRAFT_599399 [Tirmania nivea]|nr:hypothetical protein EV426DRAFT_599399 [Tirmania nivea]
MHPQSPTLFPSPFDSGPAIDTVPPPLALQEEPSSLSTCAVDPPLQDVSKTHRTEFKQNLILLHTTPTPTGIHDPDAIINHYLPSETITDNDYINKTPKIQFKPQHEAVVQWASHLWGHWQRTGLLTEEEYESCIVGPMTCHKTPNLGFRQRGSPLPSVGFESGWTQKGQSLQEDAVQWLAKGGGKIRVCILVGIEEGEIPAKKEVVLDQLLQPMGLANPPAGLQEDDVLTDTLNSPATVDPKAWVGPLRIWIEVWRYDDRTKDAYLDGDKRWSVLDEWSNTSYRGEQMPHISISDIFPSQSPPAPQDERQFTLDPGWLRMGLKCARSQYAVSRQLEHAAKLMKNVATIRR